MDKCYSTLELQPGASLEEVKQAYRDLAKVWHPDRFSHDHRLQRKAQEKLKEINYAYDRLQSYYSHSRRESSRPEYQKPGNAQAKTTENRQPPPEPPRTNAWTKLTGNWRAWTLVIILVATLVSLILFRQFGRSAKSSATADQHSSQDDSTTVLEHALSLPPSELETDLNGFRLLQSKMAVETALGPPFKKLDSESQAYRIDDDAYMVFAYRKKDPYHIASIQLTGIQIRQCRSKG